jgi:hypothetical protein
MPLRASRLSALRWYGQALDVLENTEDPDDPRPGGLLVGLGEGSARAATRPIVRPCSRPQRSPTASATRTYLCAPWSPIAAGCRAASPLRSTTTGLPPSSPRAATEGQPTPDRAVVLATLAAELAFADPDRMRLLADEAIALAHRLGDDPTLVTVTTRMEAAVSAPDTLVQRCALADEAIAAAERTRDPFHPLSWPLARRSHADHPLIFTVVADRDDTSRNTSEVSEGGSRPPSTEVPFWRVQRR